MSNLRTSNIASHLSAMAQEQPTRDAVVFPHPRDSVGKVTYSHYTFRQLEDASNRAAAGLQKIGVKRGMKVALMVPPSFEFFSLTFALFKIGAVPVLIDPGIGVKGLGKGLLEAGPEAFIGVPKAQIARLLFGWATKTVAITVTVGRRFWPGGHTLKQVDKLGAGQETFPAVLPETDETAAILFTSGSTGASKGVVYTHEFFTGQVEHLRKLYGIEPGEIDLPTFPLFALFAPALGMTAILPEMDPTRPANVDPAKIIEAIHTFGVTNMFGSPALINRVGRYGAERGIKLPTLRRAISAGAPVSAKVLERFVTMLPDGVQAFTPYGATECLPVSSIGSDEILRETRQLTDLGKGVCVGRPVEGLTVKVIRITDDLLPTWSDAFAVAPGVIGEIVVKGSHVTRTYYQKVVATALAKIKDPAGGFYHRMGDLGYLDEQGRIWFCGRKSQRVVTRNGTFFTIPCEAIFNMHPAVARSALVGVPQNSDMRPVMCIELEAAAMGQHREQLRAELLALGAKKPQTAPIKTILFHPAFPVDIRHNAKIFREKLAVWAAQQNDTK